MMENWKTTLAGVGTLLVALGHMATGMSNGAGIAAPDLMAIATAIGLIMAKDHNVTGAGK